MIDHVISGTARRSAGVLNDEYSIQAAELVLKEAEGRIEGGGEIVPVRVGRNNMPDDFRLAGRRAAFGVERGRKKKNPGRDKIISGGGMITDLGHWSWLLGHRRLGRDRLARCDD